MNIDKLLDNKNRELYKFVASKMKIELKKNNKSTWASNIIVDGNVQKAMIRHSKMTHSQASFAHELLHIKLQINGYRRIVNGIALDNSILRGTGLSIILTQLDNGFQHLRFYKEFLQLGYSGAEFYEEQSIDIRSQYEDINKNLNKYPLEQLADAYFTFVQPGGTITDEDMNKYKHALKNALDGKYKIVFTEIENLCDEWSKDSNPDVEPYIIRFFNNINGGRIWISYERNPKTMDNGFFTSERFTVDLNNINNYNISLSSK